MEGVLGILSDGGSSFYLDLENHSDRIEPQRCQLPFLISVDCLGWDDVTSLGFLQEILLGFTGLLG